MADYNTLRGLYCCGAMIRVLLMLALVTMFAGQSNAQTDGTIVIYREPSPVHYAGGVHATVYCDDLKVAKIRESRRVTVSASVGQHTCVAIERQGDANEDSDRVSVDIQPNSTTYLRLHYPFGHAHFVLREVSKESGSAEAAKVRPATKADCYTTVLPVSAVKKPSQ
jgi:hypothetical protein